VAGTSADERGLRGDLVDNGDSKEQGQGGKGQAKGQGAGQKGEQKGSSNDQAKQEQDNRKEQSKQDQQDTREAKNDTKSAQQKTSTSKSGDRSESSSPPWLAKLASALKWIVFIVLAVVAVIFVLRGGLRYLANFCDWARRLLDSLQRFWESLFGRRPRETAAIEGNAEPSRVERRPSLAFSNPFLDGRADGMLPPDLVRYSFEALGAWAQERQLGREVDETPIEFANRIAEATPELREHAKRLGVLYARVLYARGALPPSFRAAVENFWQRLDEVPARAPSQDSLQPS